MCFDDTLLLSTCESSWSTWAACVRAKFSTDEGVRHSKLVPSSSNKAALLARGMKKV